VAGGGDGGGDGNGARPMTGEQRAAKAARMEQAIRGYFAACNAGDVEAVAAFFTADGVHYFPPGMYGGPFRGGRAIGERWAWAVATLGSRWTVDEVICDPDTDRAVIEWTHVKARDGVVLRGDEWYRFDPVSGLIAEIRAYYASPQAADLPRLELEGFPYAERGYPEARA
jgi:methyltransferase